MFTVRYLTPKEAPRPGGHAQHRLFAQTTNYSGCSCHRPPTPRLEPLRTEASSARWTPLCPSAALGTQQALNKILSYRRLFSIGSLDVATAPTLRALEGKPLRRYRAFLNTDHTVRNTYTHVCQGFTKACNSQAGVYSNTRGTLWPSCPVSPDETAAAYREAGRAPAAASHRPGGRRDCAVRWHLAGSRTGPAGLGWARDPGSTAPTVGAGAPREAQVALLCPRERQPAKCVLSCSLTLLKQ